MKRLRAGSINTLSFVKLSDFTINSFDVTLEKTVGTGSLTITNLTDINGLVSCKDFIRISIDLVTNNLDGGEFLLTLTNSGNSYTFITEVQDTEAVNAGTGVYASVIRFNDL